MLELNAENLVAKEAIPLAQKAAEGLSENGTLSTLNDSLSMINNIVSNFVKITDSIGFNVKDQIQQGIPSSDPFGTHQFSGAASGAQTISSTPPRALSPPSLPPLIDETLPYEEIDELPVGPPTGQSFSKEELINALDKLIEFGGADLTLKEVREMSTLLPDQIDVPPEVLEK